MSLYYQDEYVTLYHGDCLTEHDEWTNADVLVTDPPYGIKAEVRSTYGGDMKGRGVAARSKSIRNDETVMVRDAALQAWGDKPAIVFGSWKMPRPAQTHHRLIWHKAGSSPGPTNSAFMSNDEEIYVWGRGFRKSSPPMRTVYRTDEHRSSYVRKIGHPTPKPLELMAALVDRCPPGLIADPFAGSGATLVAAKSLARTVIGIELEEKYCELIAKRCAQDVLDFGGAA